MGTGKQKAAKTAERNIGLQRTDFETVCENQKGETEKSKNPKPGRKQKPKPVAINDADQIKITIKHFFKNKINELISKIPDPRKVEQCIYSLNHLTWLGILMFFFRLRSRNQLLKERETDAFLRNLLSLSGSDEETVAHPDTMNYLFELLPVNEIEFLKVQLIKELIRKRFLDPLRMFGSFRIAVDATGLFSFGSRHCENCLVTNHNSKTTTYSHKMLEAKLISEHGFAFSICSESIENVNGEYTKQDCELKAFYRMAPVLRDLFPRTPICLLLDGIYACDEVFNISRQNNWEFITVLKEDRIPTLYKSALAEIKKYPQNELTIKSGNKTETISWVRNIQYRQHKLHVIFSRKTEILNGEKTVTNNVWVTNIIPKANNVETLINKGGKQRWKIENQGFKEQKCDGYELEHLYGENSNAWKNYYQLLQIAHMITQLIVYGDLCQKLQEYSRSENSSSPIRSFSEYYNTVRNFVRRICESFRNAHFSELTYTLIGKIQIRFSPG